MKSGTYGILGDFAHVLRINLAGVGIGVLVLVVAFAASTKGLDGVPHARRDGSLASLNSTIEIFVTIFRQKMPSKANLLAEHVSTKRLLASLCSVHRNHHSLREANEHDSNPHLSACRCARVAPGQVCGRHGVACIESACTRRRMRAVALLGKGRVGMCVFMCCRATHSTRVVRTFRQRDSER